MLRAVLTIWTFILMLSTWILSFSLQVVATVVTYPFLTPFQRSEMNGHIFRGISAFVIWLNPLWKVRVHGNRPARPKKAIVMINHLSNSDPFFMCVALFPWETKYISKSSLFKVPFGGWAMKLSGDIPVYFTSEKGGWGVAKGTTAVMFNHCKQILQQGAMITVFPEGARSRSGFLQDFKDGFFMVAVESGTPIIPVAISGSQDAWPTGDWKLNFATTECAFGEPIEAGNDVQALKQKVRAEIVRLYKTLPGAKPGYDDAEAAKKWDEEYAAKKAVKAAEAKKAE